RQRLERKRVVPVVEVAPVALEALHRRERLGGALDQLARAEVAEVVRRQVREQREPHVGRRSAVRDDSGGMLLEIVRRQPVILRADEGLEEVPGLARGCAQEVRLLWREPRLAADKRQAHPPRDGRRGEPQENDRRGKEPWRR